MQLKQSLFWQFFIEQQIIASDLHEIQDINDLFFGQFEHWIEQFLHIKFLQILQNREQFIHIFFLHEAIAHTRRQFDMQILFSHKEQISVDLFILQILHIFISFNLRWYFEQSFLFLKSLGQRIIEHFLHCLIQEVHKTLLQISHIDSDLFFEHTSQVKLHSGQIK